MSAFARRLLAEWRRLGLPARGGDAGRAVVAVSGGADSTALLLALDESIKSGRLSLKLKVAHLDHGLRAEAGPEDARFVGGLAARLGYEFESGRADVSARARARGDNLEQAARRERYEFLGRAARAYGAGLVLTAHTLDDQAETVLLALLRGSGAGGLGGMSPRRALDAAEPAVAVVRPLLAWARRMDTEGYCRARGVCWRADAMNEDEGFARVRLRRRVLPLLETFNPRAAHALARAAEILREDSAALDAEAARLLDEAGDESAGEGETTSEDRAASEGETTGEDGAANLDEAANAEEMASAVGVANADGSANAGGSANALPLRVEVLAGAASALRRRALRTWLARGRGDLRRVESAHVLAVERLLGGERGGRVAELPGGARVERRRRWLFFRPASEGRGESPSRKRRGESSSRKGDGESPRREAGGGGSGPKTGGV